MTVDGLEGTKGENKKRKRTACGFRLYTFALLFLSARGGCDVEIQIQYFLCQILVARTMNDE